MPSRYCSSPNRTISGTICTPSACASEGGISDVLSVTRWITLFEREHVRVVLLSPRLQLELGLGVRGSQAADQCRRLLLIDLVTGIHGDQFRLRILRLKHRLDDAEIIAADLGDHVINHRDDVAELDVMAVDTR